MINAKLYEALTKLVGSSDAEELTNMRKAVSIMPVPEEEKSKLVFAIDVLLEVDPGDYKMDSALDRWGETLIKGLQHIIDANLITLPPRFPLPSLPPDSFIVKLRRIAGGLENQIGNAEIRNDAYDAGYLASILKEVNELLPPQLQCNGCLGVGFEDCEACEGTGLSFEMPEYYAAPQPQGEQS